LLLSSATLLFHISFFFFFTDTAPTEIYTLSLHDALPISDAHADRLPQYLLAGPPRGRRDGRQDGRAPARRERRHAVRGLPCTARSEEHTSELQSQSNLVCRLLLEKKKKKKKKKVNKKTQL